MIDKEFVPYELALELKELGFDESCFAVYSEFDKTRVYDEQFIVEGLKVPAPTFSQAFRWFREKHELPSWVYTSNNKEYWYSILMGGRMIVRDYKPFNTYEEAELACLRKLIQIVKKEKQ